MFEPVIPDPQTRPYTSYADIPQEVRRYILDSTGERRVKRVPLPVCNELAEDYYEYEAECAELKKFQLQVMKNGQLTVTDYQDSRDAIVAFDREIDYTIGNRGVTMVITQAGRPMRGYQNGKVIYPSTIYDGVTASKNTAVYYG